MNQPVQPCFQCGRTIEEMDVFKLFLSGAPITLTGKIGEREVKFTVRHAFNNMGYAEGEKHLCGFCYYGVDEIE